MRHTLITLALLVTVIGFAAAQQTGSIGSLKGRTDSTGALIVAGGTSGDASNAEQVIQTAHLDAIETATEAVQTAVETANTLKRYISAGATEDESQVKATAGVLVSVSARNSHATADAYLKCTNLTAANTTPGSSAIFYEMLIPAGPSGVVDSNIDAAFSVALTCYIVLSKEDNAVDEVASSTVSYNLRYK